LGDHPGDAALPGTLKKRRSFVLSGDLVTGKSKRDVKQGPRKGKPSP